MHRSDVQDCRMKAIYRAEIPSDMISVRLLHIYSNEIKSKICCNYQQDGCRESSRESTTTI